MNQNNFGGENWQVNTGENNTNYFNVQEQQTPIVGIPNNLPRTSNKPFVGRSQELNQLQQQLQQANQVAIAAIAGMGGVGKSELAFQYALRHLGQVEEQEPYRGGICWLRARESDVGTQLVTFARTRLGLKVPEELDLDAQVGWCWQHWREGKVLLILDDVTDYKLIQPYLPPPDSRFKVLLTTRLQLGAIQTLHLDVLGEAAALDLLRELTDVERINRQLETAQKLCAWLGYLPLGLELVGRYLAKKPDLSLVEMQQRLEAKRLAARALTQTYDGMTAQLGVAAAFELSWQELDDAAQELCYLLSLFALAPIAWNWVEQCFPDRDTENLEDLRDDQLIWLSLLQRSAEQTYRLHQLIREFFQAKSNALEKSAQMEPLKRSICGVMAKIAITVTQTPTLKEIAQLTPAIPHLESVAHHLTEFYSDEDLIWAFVGVARFYRGQGQYGQAEPWWKKCLTATTQRLGKDHLDVASSLNNLAALYDIQGRYNEAEPLYIRSLAIWESQLGKDHPNVASSLNNLAALYDIQGRYSEAEPLYIRSLAIWESQLGKDHPNVASSLNNLALLYVNKGCYSEAEPLYTRSLQIRESQLGKDHPNVALSLNNLALLYYYQRRYSEAEPLYTRSLQIRESQLGKEHPDVAQSLNNLAGLYYSQRRYSEAEPLYTRSISIAKQRLGADHPNTFGYRENLQRLKQKLSQPSLSRLLGWVKQWLS